MKEIKATAPTPQDWIELARENEAKTEMLRECVIMLREGTQEHAEECARNVETLLENKTND